MDSSQVNFRKVTKTPYMKQMSLDVQNRNINCTKATTSGEVAHRFLSFIMNTII